MNNLKRAQDEFWAIYKEYFMEYRSLTIKTTEKILDGPNMKSKKELTAKMLEKVEKIKIKYNIEDLNIEMQDIANFEKIIENINMS